MVYTGPMMTDGGGIPADLEKDATAAAEAAGSTSANSYTKTIRMVPVKDKNHNYRFFFTYLYEDEDTKLITESERSPAYLVKHIIENETLPVKNLTLTSGFKSYGVKFDLDPLSVQEDVVIFESLTSNFAVQNIVYVGTSTNVTIQASSYAPRWVKVRSRDRWDDLNISEVTAGPVEILNSEIDTTKVPKAPTGVEVNPSIDPEDKSGFSIKIDVSWTASTDADTNGYVIRWSPNNPATVTNPLWEYGQVDGKATTKFSITGLTPNTVYYWQVTAKSPFNSISWNTGISGQVASGTFGPVSDPNAPAGNLQLRSILSIGGKTADLFKIGTGIAQSINTSTTITPTQTAGTYNGIILDRSTTNFGHNYWLNTGQFRVGSSSSFLYWDGSDIYTTGKINATGGTFTGNLRVTTGSIIAGGTFAQDGTVSGARVVMQSGGLYAHDAAGAQSVFIQSSDGLIDARKGYIGGWTLNATDKTVGYIQSANTKIESNGTITLGDITGTLGSIVRLSATDDYRLWIGSQTSSNAAFKVSKDGTLHATNAVISSTSGGLYDSIVAAQNAANSANNTAGLANTAAGNALTTASGKNSIFRSSSTPSALKAGDIWINFNDENKLYVATAAGTGSWVLSRDTSIAAAVAKADTAYDKAVVAVTKAEAAVPYGSFNKSAILQAINESTNGANLLGGIVEAGTVVAGSVIADWIYAGYIDAEKIKVGTLTGQRLKAGLDTYATGFIDTGATKTISGYGTVNYLKIKAIGLESVSNSGFVSHVYPWLDNSANLGYNSFSWGAIYIGSNAYFANGTTYKIGSTGDAYLNGYGVSGGYGVTSDWSPRSDGDKSLGMSGHKWQDVWAVDNTINTSDIRLKKDITNSSLGLNFINLLRPVSYKWKKTGVKEVLIDKEIEHLDQQGNIDVIEIEKIPKIIGVDENGQDIIETTSREGSRNHYGFVAQEVKEALDQVGIGDNFAGWVIENLEDPESTQNLRYAEFISPLVKAVQELSDMVESLQQEINTLKGI
jgi:hypothetical protein